MVATVTGGKPCLSKGWLVLHPAEEGRVLLESPVEAMEVVSVGMTMVVNLSGRGGFGEDTVAVEMATMDLVMTETSLEVAEATTILAITSINLQILDPGEEEALEAGALAPVEAKTLPNPDTRWL